MADGSDQDDSQKTEDPTQKRLDDAFDKGDVPRSQEVKHAAMLAAGLGLLMFLAAGATAQLMPALIALLGNADQFPMDALSAHDLAGGLAVEMGQALALPLGLLLLAALAGGLIQGQPTWTLEKLKPKLANISPIQGFKRLFGAQGWVEFLKTIAKFLFVGAIALWVVWPQTPLIETSVLTEPATLIEQMMALVLDLFIAVVIAVVLLAILDFAWQRYSHRQRLRMSRQDLKDEYKQTEGDPYIKARIRQLRAERARKRMMAAVPTADVIITNPTHFAVALKYDHGRMAAPRLVAKGVDSLALRIRSVATEHDVPIVENPPLARTLYAAVDIDEDIPPEHYKAVAEVISYVLRLRGRLPSRAARGREQPA
jgi:flagellar biosynthetic protein FlhB